MADPIKRLGEIQFGPILSDLGKEQALKDLQRKLNEVVRKVNEVIDKVNGG